MSSPWVIEGGLWRVRFVRQHDRYGHLIDVRVAGHYQAVLESIEGTADDSWPASPPLQDVHREERTGGVVALLVGKAGRSHWSLSIELNIAAGSMVFDAACRVSEQPAGLGSTYRLLQPPADWSLANCGFGVAIEPGVGVSEVRLQREAGKVLLAAEAAYAGGAGGSQTIRWGYCLVRG
jgi:hypothetical protein